MANAETQIQNEIRYHIGRRPDVTLWRNSTGELKDSTGRKVKFGLCVGSSDIVGILRVKIASMLVGLFLAIEVKTETGRATAEQLNFIRHVNDMGGVAFIARSVEEAATKLDEAVKRIQLGERL